MLAALDEAEAALAAQRDTVTGRVTVAAFATACRGLLPYALHRLAADHPQLRTGLIEGDPHHASTCSSAGTSTWRSSTTGRRRR